MKNNFKLLFALLLAVFMGTMSCQRDDSHLSKNFTAGNSRIISLKELKAIPKAYSRFEAVMAGQQRKTANDSVWKFTVLTENILVHEKGAGQSITFMVVPDVKRPYLENLVLTRETDGSYSVYYMVYNFTEAEKELVAENRHTDYREKFFICPLPEYDASPLLKNYPIGAVYQVGQDCFQVWRVRSQSWSDIPGQLEYSSYVEEVRPADCKDLPPSQGYTPPGEQPKGPGTPNNPVFNTPTPGPLTGYNPGSGPGAPPRREEVVTRPFIDISYVYVTPKECAKIAAVINTGSYRQDLQTLATKVNDAVNENGIGLDNSNNPITFTAGPSININGNGTTKYTAVSHTHNNQTVGTYSVFSFSDLIAFAKLMKANRIDSGTFVATLSTYKGTHYVLTISDVAKFKEFFFYTLNVFSSLDDEGRQKYSNSFTKADGLRIKYYDDKNNPLIKQTDINNTNVLNQFHTFMNEADMGVMIFETDATFQNFTQVKKSNNGQITKTPCN